MILKLWCLKSKLFPLINQKQFICNILLLVIRLYNNKDVKSFCVLSSTDIFSNYLQRFKVHICTTAGFVLYNKIKFLSGMRFIFKKPVNLFEFFIRRLVLFFEKLIKILLNFYFYLFNSLNRQFCLVINISWKKYLKQIKN